MKRKTFIVPQTVLPQQEKQWFDPACPEFAPSEEARRWWIDLDNPDNPFSKFIGNEKAVKRLCRAAFTALERHNRCCRDQSFALLGPASTGKTTLAKMFAELIDLPFVEINPRSILSLDDILFAIASVMENTPIQRADDLPATLELVPDDQGLIIVPPCIVFIDEVHSLRNNIVQGLLKATEKSDNKLIVEGGWVVDCKNICWHIATTDRGSLFDAFDTRFNKVNLRLYSRQEIAMIVKINHPDWSDETCELVARYAGHVPREALAFASEMQLEYNLNGGDWDEIASTIADDNEIDEYGMTYQRRKILVALHHQPISRNRMATVAGCKEEELEKFVMPPLLAETPDRPALVEVSTRGYRLTEEGQLEVRKYVKPEPNRLGNILN